MEQWESFKATYGKNYNSMHGQEDTYRFSVFQTNLRRAEEIQRGDAHATYGVTQFMDLTQQEFQAMYSNLNVTAVAKWHSTLPVFKFGSKARRVGAVDWRKDRVTPVKNQGSCGSCWSFSAAAAAEACNPYKSRALVSLSPQQVMDCCTAGGSNGCSGGWPDQCLQYMLAEEWATWDSYPYQTAKGTCKSTGFTVGLSKGSCSFYGFKNNEDTTRAALTKNPVSVCLDATPLQYYTSGIISGTTCANTKMDHAVLLVADDGSTLTVKNSWGAGWGEAGYFRMKAGVNCLVYTQYNSQVV
jgi:C1A family cysteine protease